MEIEQILGLDVGKKRTGVARASSAAKLAQPLGIIKTDEGFKELKKVVKENEAGTIVVGLPRNLQGDDTAQTAWVRDWVKRAQAEIDLPFYWQDEALTTKTAELKNLSRKNPIDVDAMAAAIILQDFLDGTEAERSPV